ncbi:MAG TPA: hypothetical protein GXX51_07740 [Firmicutes bacterium]|nr:hypothetical protein [Bacillota bacterium]
MNSYERVVTTLSGEIPDRVPTFELLVDPGVMRQITGSDDYLDFCEQVELDIVLTNTPSKLYEEKVLDAGKGLVINEWGVVRRYGEQAVSIPVEGPIKDPHDLDSYRPPDPYAEKRYEQLRAIVKRFKGKKFIGMHLHDAFNYPFYLRGMEQFFMDTVENPELVHRLVRLSVDHNIAIAERAIDLGADFIILGDDYGSSGNLLMSPKTFREFIIPGLREVVQAVKAKGAYCFKHCCGNINAILDDVVGSGIDALHPFDAAAGMDIVGAKARYPRLTVMGGINCGAPLSDYPVEDLVEEVKRTLAALMPGGRYILSSSNTIHNKVRPENVLAMWRTVREFGVYH